MVIVKGIIVNNDRIIDAKHVINCIAYSFYLNISINTIIGWLTNMIKLFMKSRNLKRF